MLLSVVDYIGLVFVRSSGLNFEVCCFGSSSFSCFKKNNDIGEKKILFSIFGTGFTNLKTELK